MKRTVKIKLIAICIILAFLCNTAVLAVEPSSAGTIGKISEDVSAKLTNLQKDEKVSVYIYFEDKSDSVISTMKTEHAELYATYAAAKGAEAAATENVTALAADMQRAASTDAAKLQTAIETKRHLYSAHYSAQNTAVLEKHCADEEVLFVSAYTPMAIVSVTARELKALAQDASVTRIALFEDQALSLPKPVAANAETRNSTYIEEHWNLNSRAEFVRDALNCRGDGVKIGQVEWGLPYVEDQMLADATIITNSAYGGEEWESSANENHATNVALILVGGHGIAPDATLYSACYGDKVQFYNAIEWLVSQGVNVINLSAGWSESYYDAVCAFVDHLAVQHDVHFVAASGNILTDTQNVLLGSPARAYNAIVVGAYDDNNTVPANDSEISAKQRDDSLADYSKCIENISISHEDVGAHKPNLVATGNYFWNDPNIEGTSFAAPQVAGVIAQLCGYEPTLKTKQTSIGAILMASCGRKLLTEVDSQTLIETNYEFKGGDFSEAFSEVSSDNQISDTQGAGKLDAYWAQSIVGSGDYWSLNLDSSVTEYTKNVYLTKNSESITRIALFWLKRNYTDNHTGSDVTQMNLPNWNLYVYDANGEEIDNSRTTYNNYEIVQFVPPASGTYTIKIVRSASANNELSYVGLAVCEI